MVRPGSPEEQPLPTRPGRRPATAGRGLRFDVRHTPAILPAASASWGIGAVFSGDVLFAGSIGRTDLPAATSKR